MYGSLAAADAYIGARFGDRYRAWEALDATERTRSLVSAGDYLDALTWAAPWQDPSDRASESAIVNASYELAAMGAEDAEIFTLADQGSNISSVSAGGASVTYFEPPAGAGVDALPFIVQRLVGPFLVGTGGDIGPEGGTGETGGCVNPFGPWMDFDRRGPY